MTNLLEEDGEIEKIKSSLLEKDLLALPQLVPETQRYGCCVEDCTYYTIDSTMLLYHIQTIHSELTHYQCQRCVPDAPPVPFDQLEFHVRCHADLLFKCPYCPYYNWLKRTAERHVSEKHPTSKLMVLDIRQEMKALRERKAAAQAAKSDKSGGVQPGSNLGGNKNSSSYLYRPYKCGLCDSAEETVADIRDHCKSVHENDKQVRPLTQFFSVSFFWEKSFFCLECKSMTALRANTFLFPSSQQLSRLGVQTLEGLF